MPNLNETIRIRTEVDNSLAEQGLNQLPIKVRRAGDRMTQEMSNAGRKAGDAFGKEFDSRINKSMRLVGQTFSRYFGEWGRMFGEIFQIGKDVSEIIPSRRRGGHGAGSSAGIIGADVGSDVGQTVAQAQGFRKLNGNLNGKGFGAAILGSASTGAAAGGLAGALPGLGIGLAVGAVVGTLGYLGVKMAEARKETKEFATALGLSTEKAKEFMEIGKATGNLDAFTQSLTRLTDLLEKARKGSKEAVEELKKLGVNSVFSANDKALEDVFNNINGMSSQRDRDVATVRAGFSVSDMNALELKKARDQFNGSDLKVLEASGDMEGYAKRVSEIQAQIDQLSVDAITLRNRQGSAQITINEQDKLTKVDPAKTREAEQVAKAVEEQRDAAEELADIGKNDVAIAQNKIDSIKEQIQLAEILLDNAQDIGEKEATSANIAKLKVQLAERELALNRAQLAEKNKLTNIENNLVESKLKAASDGKLSLSELGRTNTPAGREAGIIGNLEEQYKNAVAGGNSGLADRIRKNIDSRKLGLVNAGILSPDELTYEQFDEFGNKTQSGFNKADVLAGINNRGPLTAADRLKYARQMGKAINMGQRVGSMTDFIRGVKADEVKNDIKGNAVSLLDVINRNGGALPVKALIQ